MSEFIGVCAFVLAAALPAAASDDGPEQAPNTWAKVLSEDQLIPQRRRTPPLSQPSAGALRRIGAFVRLTDGPVRGPRYADAIDLSRPRPIAGPPAWERRIPPEQLDERGRP